MWTHSLVAVGVLTPARTLCSKAQDHVALASATTAWPTTVEDHPSRADDWPDRQCRSMPTTAPRAGKHCGDSGGTFSTMSPRMRMLMSATDVTSPSWGQNKPTGSKSAPGRASQARPISRPWGQPKTLPRHPASLCSSSRRHGVVTFQRHTVTRTVSDIGPEAPSRRGGANYHLITRATRITRATCRPLLPRRGVKTAGALTAAVCVA